MDLINFTPYPALLYRFTIDDDRMGAAVVARITYDIVRGTLTPCAEQPWGVSPMPWETEYGPMEADEVFYRAGVDVFLFGHARAPGRGPVARVDVGIEVGAFRHAVAVFGERAWLPAGEGDTLVPSRPRPFVEMPLTMARAYGGTAEWDELQVPYADNPDGKGFYLEREQAVGQPLPNIEDPRQLIQRWDDRPPAVGVGACPLANSRRLGRGTEFTSDGALNSLRPALFNAAYPEMVAPRVAPGDVVRLTGVTHDGVLSFVVPPSPLRFALRLGDVVAVRDLAVDQIGVEPDRNRAFIAYRYPFRYVMYAQQPRSAELSLREG